MSEEVGSFVREGIYCRKESVAGGFESRSCRREEEMKRSGRIAEGGGDVERGEVLSGSRRVVKAERASEMRQEISLYQRR